MSFTQDIFWLNLPSKILGRNKLNEKFRNTLKKTFLHNEKEITFLYTGTNNINFNFLDFDPKIKKKLSKRHIQVFLYEPVSYYFISHEHNLGYYTEFHSSHTFSPNLRADELDSLSKLSRYTKTLTVNHCDYGLTKLLGKTYSSLNLQCRDIFLRQAAQSWMPDNNEVPAITKRFWCGNGRYTIHRHIIMCYLADKSGNFSWWFNADIDWHNYADWIENLPYDILEKNNEILNNNTFSLDFETKKLDVSEKHKLYIPKGPFSDPGVEYKKTFDPCFVCIINETRFAQPTANFSEKVIDAINYKKPFIIAGPPRTLEYIQQLGIKTFSEYWSELYDRVSNHNDRMLEIFKLIDTINQLSFEELNQIYQEMQPILEHNKRVIKDLPLNKTIIHDT